MEEELNARCGHLYKLVYNKIPDIIKVDDRYIQHFKINYAYYSFLKVTQ